MIAIDAEAVRERGVDVERLLRDVGLAFGREVRERPHVVGAVRELDEDDADVARHRDDHLAEIIGLRLGAALEIDLTDLGDAVDERRDLGPEDRLDLSERRERVLHRVVQEARGDARHVEPEVGDEPRDLERVDEVRLPRLPLLAPVHLGRKLVGALDRAEIGGRIVLAHFVEEPGEVHGPASTTMRLTRARSASTTATSCATASSRSVLRMK